jgi:hypothetical protein
MAERSALFETVQIGKETTPGTAVAADKKLLATGFEVSINADVNTYRPNGYKFNTIGALDFEMVEGNITGIPSYTDLTYLFSSLISADTPAASGTTGQEWVFTSDSDGPDAPVTYTIEQGSSVRAHSFANGQVTGLTLTINDDGVEMDGTIIGEALEDGITMTAAPTEIALQPVMRTEVGLKLNTSAAGLPAASLLTRGFAVEWSLTDRFAPLKTLNGTSTYDVVVESEPTGEIKLMLEADAAGMVPLTHMRAGSTLFLRIQATGPVIGAGPATYSLIIDTAFKVTDVSDFQVEQDVIAIEWTGTFVHDSTWGKAFNISLINALTAL